MKTVLFDLDGTLLPMEQEHFTKAYFKALSAHMVAYGYEPQKLIAAVWKGTKAMLVNDGAQTNEKVFWHSFAEDFGQRIYDDVAKFDEFYETKFDALKAECGFNARAAQTVKKLKARGVRLVLASNPVFPLTAHVKRMRWAGLDENEFCHITSYSVSSYCKPSAGYYAEIARTIGEDAKNCVMIGNDVSDDMPARDASMDVFLLTDNLLNARGADITCYRRGGFDELDAFLDETV